MNFKEKVLKSLSKSCNSCNSCNKTVYSLWMGPDLSIIEILSIMSFLKNGHKYILYTYGDIKNIPNGVEVRDGSKILSEDCFQKVKINCPDKYYTTFANWFRCEMLYCHGGWWVDLDIICLKYLDFTSPYVFSQFNQIDDMGNQMVNNGIIKSPSRTSIFKFYKDMFKDIDEKIPFGATGPGCFYYIIKKYGLTTCIYPTIIFEPKYDVDIFKKDVEVSPDTYAIHLHNSQSSCKNKTWVHNSLMEKLKRTYL